MTKRITISTLDAMKASGDKFVMITAYDATFARLASEAGAETILVGDSLLRPRPGQRGSGGGNPWRATGTSRPTRGGLQRLPIAASNVSIVSFLCVNSSSSK